MKVTGYAIVSILALCVVSRYAEAQSAPDTGCSLQPPAFTSKAPNIFNDQQEQWLGDALAEYTEVQQFHLADSPVDDQLTRIGEKLLATLPPTGVHYYFRIWDSGQINAYSTAGGRIYISRKLIAAAKNEDELAGVMAHEIGHIRTHQMAVRITNELRLRLGITEVGDRADVFAKVHQLFNTPPKQYEKDDPGEDIEVVADHVAMYALVRAGYRAESFPEFFDRIAQNHGKMGDGLSDWLGVTNEASKRYREALALVAELPSECKEKQSHTSETYEAWHRAVVEERVKATIAAVAGDQPITLDPPLRPSLSRIRFSPDGRLILAQDESGITVTDKDAAKVLFRIDAPDVDPAQFTSDSKSVIFGDSKLRVEQWSVADGKRTSVKELVVYEGCNQTLITPDAKNFVCAFAHIHGEVLQIGVKLIDIDSGQPFFDKPDFFEPGVYTPYAMRLWQALRTQSESQLMSMLTSPDGRYLLLVAGDRVQAFDIASRKPIALSGKLKELSQARMSFLGPGQLYAVFQGKGNGMYVARVLTFPDGQLVSETEIANQEVEAVTKGPALIIHPLKDYPVGIFDPVQGKVLTAAKLPAIDAWDSTIALEDAMGGVAVAQLGVTGSRHIALPLGSLPTPQAALFSPDGKYVAVSMKNRAMIWNLETGKQAKLVRPFESAWMDGDGHLFGQFPKFLDRDPAVLQLTLEPFASKDLGKLEEGDLQYTNLEYRFKSMGKEEPNEHVGMDALQEMLVMRGLAIKLRIKRYATLVVKKMDTQTVAWSRDYPDETPYCWPAEDNRLVLAWDLTYATAQSELKSRPALQEEAEALKDRKKGLLIETVVAETGAPVEQVVIPEEDPTRGFSDERKATVSGKFVLSRSDDGVTSIYRIENGKRVGEFIGETIASDAASGVIAAKNRGDEILLVDERTGKELKRFSLGSPVRAARIVSGKEKSLLVLTADQTVHRLPLPQSEAAQSGSQ